MRPLASTDIKSEASESALACSGAGLLSRSLPAGNVCSLSSEKAPNTGAAIQARPIHKKGLCAHIRGTAGVSFWVGLIPGLFPVGARVRGKIWNLFRPRSGPSSALATFLKDYHLCVRRTQIIYFKHTGRLSWLVEWDSQTCWKG